MPFIGSLVAVAQSEAIGDELTEGMLDVVTHKNVGPFKPVTATEIANSAWANQTFNWIERMRIEAAKRALRPPIVVNEEYWPNDKIIG